LRFTLVNEKNEKQAYQLLVDRTIQLINNGSKQYVKPYPSYDVYHERTLKNENWILSDDLEIFGIVTIVKNGIGAEWKDIYCKLDHFWIASLFVSAEKKHRNIGRLLIENCIKIAKVEKINELLLDCYIDSDFLENYYMKYGFVTLVKKLFVFPNRKFNAALMKLTLN